jgi:hypothetical protein
MDNENVTLENEEITTEEIIETFTEEPVEKPQKRKKKSPKPDKVSTPTKIKESKLRKFKIGDRVRVSARVGCFLDRKRINWNILFSSSIINDIIDTDTSTESIIELKDAAGTILGRLFESNLSKVN